MKLDEFYRRGVWAVTATDGVRIRPAIKSAASSANHRRTEEVVRYVSSSITVIVPRLSGALRPTLSTTLFTWLFWLASVDISLASTSWMMMMDFTAPSSLYQRLSLSSAMSSIRLFARYNSIDCSLWPILDHCHYTFPASTINLGAVQIVSFPWPFLAILGHSWPFLTVLGDVQNHFRPRSFSTFLHLENDGFPIRDSFLLRLLPFEALRSI